MFRTLRTIAKSSHVLFESHLRFYNSSSSSSSTTFLPCTNLWIQKIISFWSQSPQFSLSLDTIAHPSPAYPSTSSSSSILDVIMNAIWWAVPKRKVSPGKKRMKTTLQNRISTKSHVIIDRRTGEYTLRHRLPWNWKDYLPENIQPDETKSKE